jgi:hypothetical protein
VFSEDFAGAFPGSAWSVRAGTAAVEPGLGAPPPALRLGPNAARVEYVGAPFAVPPALTIYALIRADYAFGAPIPGGGGVEPAEATFHIVDANIGTVFAPLSLATVAITPQGGAPPGSVRVTYRIMTTTLGTVQSTESLPADLAFHDFAFDVDSAGRGSWHRDGVQKLSTGGSTFHTTSGEVRFQFENAATPSHQYFVDEVLVRR